MMEPCIAGKSVSLRLLSLDDLRLWLEGEKRAELSFGLTLDAEKIEGRLLFAFTKKIENMENDPGFELWYSYYAVVFGDTIIGLIGPKGKPDGNGRIEIGYGLSEKYRNRGIATEAVGLLCGWYFSHTDIRGVAAETEGDNVPSQKVLLKNGFTRAGESADGVLWDLPACKAG